jgi:hypothetical protein
MGSELRRTEGDMREDTLVVFQYMTCHDVM